jgi:hypothetical protein
MVDRPTMQTVATAAGVSRMTVSNAYNRPDQLTADTRERVLQIARELGYPGPDPAAQSLRRKSTGTIAVVLTSRLTEAFTDPGLVIILHGIASQLSDAGRALLLVPTSAAESTFPVRHAIADAFILCDLVADDPAVTAGGRVGWRPSWSSGAAPAHRRSFGQTGQVVGPWVCLPLGGALRRWVMAVDRWWQRHAAAGP